MLFCPERNSIRIKEKSWGGLRLTMGDKTKIVNKRIISHHKSIKFQDNVVRYEGPDQIVEMV